MFFTKNDFEKIAEYLKDNAMKDTDFSKKESVSVNSDILTIVSNGVNYKVYIADLLKSGIPLVTIDNLKAASIQTQDIKANRSLIINASNIRLDNDKGVTLLDVLDYFEENKLDRHASTDTFDGHLTIDNGLTVNDSVTIKGPTTITGNTIIKGTTTISGDSINLGNTTITDLPNDVKINKSLVVNGDVTALISTKKGTKSIHLSDASNAIAGILPMYTIGEYNALKQEGKLEHKMYCIYKNGILTRIYIYETLIAKRAQLGQITTGSTFPIIFPIIFA